jgi:thioredoxin-related protein
MKKIIISIIVFACFSFADWHHNLDDVKLIAKKEHRLILLNFSGSDWCAPCNRLRTEIFESDVFKKFAEQKLVLLNADFPRMKKNQLSQKQQEINNALADKYNSKGSFPLTLLLDADGKVLQEWDGYPKVKTTEEFLVQLQAITDAVNTSNN